MEREDTLTDQIYALGPGETLTFPPEVNRRSVRTLAARTGTLYDRKFCCRQAQNGYQVWRLA